MDVKIGTALNGGKEKPFDPLSHKLCKTDPGMPICLVRPGAGYQSKDAAAVHDDILERIGDLDLKVVEVSEIPKTPQGKTALVIRLADRPNMRPLYGNIFQQ